MLKKILSVTIYFLLILMVIASTDGRANEEKVISATGYGVPPAKSDNSAQARLMAREAAIAYGYWALARQLEEVRVSSDTKVKDFMTQSQTVNLSVNNFIKGARIVAEKENADGTYVVNMELPLENEGTSIIKIVAPVVQEKPVSRKKGKTGVVLNVKLRGINPVAKIYVNHEEIRNYEKKAQYFYYDYTKFYDDGESHAVLLEAQTYVNSKLKQKKGEVLLNKEIELEGGRLNELTCLAEFDFRSLECNNSNPYGY